MPSRKDIANIEDTDADYPGFVSILVLNREAVAALIVTVKSYLCLSMRNEMNISWHPPLQ